VVHVLVEGRIVKSGGKELALELEDKGPHFPQPLRSHADVDRLRVPDPGEALGFVLETVRRTKKELAGTVPLIGFCGGPWTLAAYMIEGKTSRSFEKAKAALLGDEALASTLLGKISDALIAYLQAQLDAGADALQIFDSWAGALAPDDYARIGAPWIARVVRGLKRNGQPLTVFGVETGELLGILSGTGADMVGVDWRVSLSEARRRTGDAVALQGNLDPASLFLPQPILESRVRRVLEDARAAGRGHVFNLGHGILPTTPPDNAKLVVDLIAAAIYIGTVVIVLKSVR